MKIIGLLILTVFYAVYISKMVLQKRKGIQTDQIAKGKQKTKVLWSSIFVTLVTKKYRYSTTLPFALRMVCDNH